MSQRPQPYISQIHVCINNRNGESPSCGYNGSEEIVARFASSEAGASMCALSGPNMMIWPEALWYMKVIKDDVPQIVDQYLKFEEADKSKEAAAAK